MQENCNACLDSHNATQCGHIATLWQYCVAWPMWPGCEAKTAQENDKFWLNYFVKSIILHDIMVHDNAFSNLISY